ncbi:MAG TPA: hypothetical protein VMS00_06750, partial [Acidimicrobiales bacterium]|nr:hypothetical protein [Acidimicrobiales bacterium]
MAATLATDLVAALRAGAALLAALRAGAGATLAPVFVVLFATFLLADLRAGAAFRAGAPFRAGAALRARPAP